MAVACAVALTCAACRSGPAALPQRRINVLLVTIDTLRADRIGAGIAPGIDRLAAASVQFTAARAAVPLTLPSHTTIHTGLLPPIHGVHENGVAFESDAHPTLATLLKRAGYRTAAFVGAFVLDRRFGLAQGFDVYDDRIPRHPDAFERLEAERPAAAVIEAALAWLSHNASPAESAPFFLWIHLYDPHAPYAPPSEFRGARSLYDGEVAYVDAQITRLLEWLRSRALLDRMAVVVAGDHGEGLGDHGERTHGMLLYDSTLRVPLVVAAPGRAPQRRDDPVSLADVAPTILRAAGVGPPAGMNGRDLFDRDGAPADLYSETEYPRAAGWAPLEALTDGRWKTIRAGAATEVYDLGDDPGETRNLASSHSGIAAAMLRTIGRIRANPPAAGRAISRETEERLRALGYVSSSPSSAIDPHAPNPATRIAAWNAFEDALSALNERRPEAAAALERLAAEYGDARLFQTTYARALKDKGDPGRALEVYRAAAKRWSPDAMLLHDLAVAARDTARRARGPRAAALRSEAVRAEEAAIAVDPNNALAHNALGLIAVEDNRLQAAIAAFARATAIDRNNASYRTNLGNAKRAAGDLPGAEQAYRSALDVDPSTVDAANGLGVVLVETHRPADAVPWLERATRAAPDFVEARLNLAIALQQSGNSLRAADEYRRILAADPVHKREREAAAALLASLGAGR